MILQGKKKSRLKQEPLAFIDLETTGLSTTEHEIIEIGCIVADQTGGDVGVPKIELREEIELRVIPRHIETADAEALAINGYSKERWVDAIDLKEALEIIRDKTEGCILVGQNVTFDWNFLAMAFQQEDVDCLMDYHRVDTMSMAFAKFQDNPKMQSFSLRVLAEHFGIEQKNAHRALDDIRVTFEVYKKLIAM
ncbi:MAG: 3'-5' exonuclease [bacterium]|nr:3'-5' exonuclease [bacterium]